VQFAKLKNENEKFEMQKSETPFNLLIIYLLSADIKLQIFIEYLHYLFFFWIYPYCFFEFQFQRLK